MKKVVLIGLLLIVAAGAGYLVYWHWFRPLPSTELILYGNVDLRQVQLAFNNSERIGTVLVEEGNKVTKGQLVAQLDTSRLRPQVELAAAQVAVQQHIVDRLHNGSRPEEIAEARANVDAAKADAANARRQYDRLKNLLTVRLKDQTQVQAVSQEDVDNAKAAWEVSEAKRAYQEQALKLAIIGPRVEDIKENEARLQANEAQHDYLKQQLADTNLYAPTDAIVRNRLLEPGEMVTPQKPVFLLAIVNPKWVRAYVSEPDLNKVRLGMTASVAVDTFPGRRFDGWVGFVSPVAEFTPKPVQTEQLRSSLVYEVRVFVKDPANELRLGSPATVYLPLNGGASAEAKPGQ